MAKVSNKKTTTSGKETTDNTRISFDTQKARESLLNKKGGVCPFCGKKL